MKLFSKKSGKLSIKDIEEIYLREKNALLKFAYALVGNAENAEDIVADVFVGFAKAAGRKQSFTNVKAYLTTAVLNKARNYYRDSSKRQTTDLDNADCFMSYDKRPEQWVVLSEELELLAEAMGELPDVQRETVLLYMDGSITFKKIAEAQGVSLSTAQGRFRYGIDKLQRLLNNEVTR